jgi:hypothetical protein
MKKVNQSSKEWQNDVSWCSRNKLNKIKIRTSKQHQSKTNNFSLFATVIGLAVSLNHGCHSVQHHLYVCIKINAWTVDIYICVCLKNWSYFARDNIVCPNKLSFNTCKAKVPHRTRSLLDWHSSHSLGHSLLLFLLSLPLSLSLLLFLDGQFWEVCNEMKIVERKRECVSRHHHSSMYVCMNKSNDKRRHVGKVRKRVMIIISLTWSHSWSTKVP